MISKISKKCLTWLIKTSRLSSIVHEIKKKYNNNTGHLCITTEQSPLPREGISLTTNSSSKRNSKVNPHFLFFSKTMILEAYFALASYTIIR